MLLCSQFKYGWKGQNSSWYVYIPFCASQRPDVYYFTDIFMDVVRTGPFYSPYFDFKLPQMLNRDFSEPKFSLRLLMKDVKLIEEYAQRCSLSTSLHFGAHVCWCSIVHFVFCILMFQCSSGLDCSLVRGMLSILEKGMAKGDSEKDMSCLYSAINPEEWRFHLQPNMNRHKSCAELPLLFLFIFLFSSVRVSAHFSLSSWFLFSSLCVLRLSSLWEFTCVLWFMSVFSKCCQQNLGLYFSLFSCSVSWLLIWVDAWVCWLAWIQSIQLELLNFTFLEQAKMNERNSGSFPSSLWRNESQ